jgi:hypothetical protein
MKSGSLKLSFNQEMSFYTDEYKRPEYETHFC